MEEKKKELYKELINYFKNLTVLGIVSFLLNKDISLAKFLFKIDNARLAWFIDVGAYTSFFLALITIILYWYRMSKTDIRISMYYSEERMKKVKLKGDENKEIILEIIITGNNNKIPENLIVYYPDWLVFQILKKDRNYISVDDTKNQYIFDLPLLVGSQKQLNLKRSFSIDIIADSEEKDSIEIVPEIDKIKKFSLVSTKISGIEIELKGK